jgi:hypothetical protein
MLLFILDTVQSLLIDTTNVLGKKLNYSQPLQLRNLKRYILTKEPDVSPNL